MKISEILSNIDEYVNTELEIEAYLFVPRNKKNVPYLQSTDEGLEAIPKIMIDKFSEILRRKLISVRKTKLADPEIVKIFAYIEKISLQGILTLVDDVSWITPISVIFRRDTYTQYVPANIIPFDTTHSYKVNKLEGVDSDFSIERLM